MKKCIVIGIMAVLAMYGCQVKEMREQAPLRDAKVFTATIEDDAFVETKTSLDSDGNVLWKQGDQVSIFAGSTINEQYQVTDASDGETAASLYQVTSPGFVAGTDIDNNVAFYPYAATVSIAKRESSYILKRITLPSIQYYAEGSFGNGAFPMTAVTSSPSDYNLKFKNVLGGLKLQLKGTATIASISITGNGNEILCGAAEVTVTNGSVPSISLTNATAKTVTLDCGNGVQLNTATATPFIIALPAMTMEGGFTVIVTDTENCQMEIKTTKSQTITRSRMLKMPAVTYEGTLPVVEHQYVDLGLPSGLKWATCNVGANAPEEYGDYFAWGETEPKDNYDWSTYIWCNGSANTLTKYNNDSTYGLVDNKTTLEMEDDAARANWGGEWRMPTKAEFLELIVNCTSEWVTQNGVNGRKFTGNNGNSIFLPAAGGLTYADSWGPGYYGYYWSSFFYVMSDSYRLDFGEDFVKIYSYPRFEGYPIRPVIGQGLIDNGEESFIYNAGADTYMVPAEGVDIVVDIHSNVDYFTTINCDWINTEDGVTFHIAPNEGSERMATIEFTYDSFMVTISVNQAAYELPIEVMDIVIDGDMSDWTSIGGVTNNDGPYAEFKITSDEDNIYLYSRRTMERFNDIWAGSGYFYYAFDLDNNPETGDVLWENGPYEMIFVIWPFGGSADAPEFALKYDPSCICPSTCTLSNAVVGGIVTEYGVEVEISIPRSDLIDIPDAMITVYSWGNKSGNNMKNTPLLCHI